MNDVLCALQSLEIQLPICSVYMPAFFQFDSFRTIVDSSYINTVDDLVDQLKSNTMLGSDTEVLLIFERDVSALPEPAEALEAVPK